MRSVRRGFVIALVALAPIVSLGWTVTAAPSLPGATPWSAAIQPNNFPLAGRTIVIDAGHGGTDPGARDHYEVKGAFCPWISCPDEKDLNLRAALWARDLLKAQGASVVMTRETDVTVSLAQRVAVANAANADLFVSVHHNSCCGGRGTETFYYGEGATYSVEGKALAREIQDRVVANLGTYDRGIHADADWLGYHLHVLRYTRMPAALVEVAFMDSQADYDRALRPDAAILVGEAIEAAVVERSGSIGSDDRPPRAITRA